MAQKSGQNLKHEKTFFQTGLSDASRRNTRDILSLFISEQSVNQKAKNISRQKKRKK